MRFKNINTKEVALELYKATDEEFAEIFAYLNQLLHNDSLLNCKKDEDEAQDAMVIDAKYMNVDMPRDIPALANWISSSLNEIITDPETDSYAWWKVNCLQNFEVSEIRSMNITEYQRIASECPRILQVKDSWWIDSDSDTALIVNTQGVLEHVEASERHYLRPIIIIGENEDTSSCIIGGTTILLGDIKWIYVGDRMFLAEECFYPDEYIRGADLNTWLHSALADMSKNAVS